AAAAVEVAGDVQSAQQRDRLLVAARRPHLLSVQDGRALGIDQQVGELLDVARIAERAGRGAVVPGLRDDRLGYLDLAIEDVARNFQVHRSRGAVEGFSRRHRDHVRHALGARHGGGELGDRRHEIDVRQVLERSHLVLRERALPADVQHRTLGAKGRGNPGHGIGAAGSVGGDHAPELAGLARVTVRGVSRDLLMANAPAVVPAHLAGALPVGRRKSAVLRRQPVASFGVAPTVPDRFVYALRRGFRIATAISAARILSVAAVMNTPCQFPFAATITLASGTSSEAVPFAVYMRPVLVVAYVAPKVSVTVAGKRL